MPNKNHTCVLTTFYPGVEKFFDDFLESVQKQSVSDFDLVIVDDDGNDLEVFLANYKLPPTKIIFGNGNVAENRSIGFRYVLEQGYKNLILADADDYFRDNRVAVSVDLLKQSEIDVVVNDVHLCDQNGVVLLESYFSKRLSNNQKIDSTFLEHSNCCGLSNTSLKLACLRGIDLNFSGDVIDWTLYTRLSLKGANIVYTNRTHSIYRQYTENVIGIGRDLSKSRLELCVNVKKMHYRLLAKQYPQYLTLAEYFDNLYTSIDSEDFEFYLSRCSNMLPDFPFWWEEAIYWEK